MAHRTLRSTLFGALVIAALLVSVPVICFVASKASLAILRFESYAVSFRGALLREPGIHTPGLVVMDSGLATKRWRPGMTEPRFANCASQMIGFSSPHPPPPAGRAGGRIPAPPKFALAMARRK